MTIPTTTNPSIATFAEFGLPSFLLESLKHMKVTVPTPVQSGAIPPALKGLDILASAQTGTGKTIAYLIPLLTTLQNQAHGCALVLAPTRELAAQVKETVRQLIGRQHINSALLIGGEPMFKQYAALKRRPRIVIGTPGRINDHLSRGTLKLNDAHFLVLDETDRMLDMGFSQALETIARHLPEKRQTFMFSATLPPGIIKMSQNYLNNPQRIAIGSVNEPCAKIKQEMIQTTSSEKFSCLLKTLSLHEGSKIIFVKTKIGADKLADKLKEHKMSVAAIHGDLKQRRRDQVIKQFREERIHVLVATDVAARGLDIPHIEVVVNFDLPQCPEDYIHRIGRTGRAGREGIAISFISPDERWKWKAIQNLIHAKSGKEKSFSGHFSERSERGSAPAPRSKRYGNKRFAEEKRGQKPTTGFRKSSAAKGKKSFTSGIPTISKKRYYSNTAKSTASPQSNEY